MKISFNSIVPQEVAIHCLSFTNLKSYLLANKCDDEIVSNLYYCEDSVQDITEKILLQHSDLIAFSAYIWNIDYIEQIATKIKEKASDAIIIIGGPEAMYNSEDILRDSPAVDILARGEAEVIMPLVLEKIRQDKGDFADIPGICYINNGQIIYNEPAEQLNLAEQHYEVHVGDFLDSKEFLYETFRGCPFRCNFCSWQYTQGIRYYPLSKVMADLEKIFTLPQLEVISFADSNLLLNKTRCLEIFKFINERNRQRIAKKMPQVLPHFEINPEYFDDELIEEFIKFSMDPNRIYTVHLGLQSTDKDTLKACNRKWNAEKYIENYRKIISKGFDSFHFEIIHGLPGDTLEKYKKTLDFLLSELNADRFLSFYYLVVPGSYFREHAKEFGLVWEDKPPYRLIRSNTFSEEDLDQANQLSYYLQLIFNALPRIKKVVDSKIKNGKLRVYEKIIDYITENYAEQFNPRKNLDDWTLAATVQRMGRPEHYHIRRDIINHSRDIVKNYAERCV